MKNGDPSVLAVIPARAGSRGLPGKNLLSLCGRPLLAYTLDAIRESRLIHHAIATTNDPEFALMARRCGLPVIAEPEELADDTAPLERAVDFAVSALERQRGSSISAVVICQPNVPIRPAGIVDRVVLALEETGAEVVYTLEPAGHHHPFWSVELIDGRVHFPLFVPQTYRQALPPRFHLTAAAFAYRRDRLSAGTLQQNAVGVVHGAGECIDIDTPIDAEFAEFQLSRRSAGHCEK